LVPELIVHRGSGLIEAEVDGEIVALHVENGQCYGFNGTATIIWKLIETPRSVASVRDELLQKFDVEPDVCEAQLMELLRELESDRLIELRSPEG
jgi:hypothetical protein